MIFGPSVPLTMLFERSCQPSQFRQSESQLNLLITPFDCKANRKCRHLLLCFLLMLVLHLKCVSSAIMHFFVKARSLFQFGGMVACSTNRSMFDYVDYGCWCGSGGSGKPVDQTDR